MGMSALASSSVELEAHQIEVVRRILQDPVQRYLLADEVGLGKTIEAGILISQCILDAGDHALVLVIVPEALVSQWRSELESKFFLGGFLDKTIHVLGFKERNRIQPLLGKAAMLVIDEAHHLTGHRPANHPGGLYDDIAAAAPKIERVLLLSATPALQNERGFLEMLHLLDHDTYKLADEEGFRLRAENRQALAGIVAGLTPENVLYLDHPLDCLVEMFPDDTLLQEQSRALRAISDKMPAEDDPALIEAVGRVRAHLSESYRLHRRILRHRRRSVAGLTPDRSGLMVVSYASPEVHRLIEALEDWRITEASAVFGAESDSVRKDRVRVFSGVLNQILEYAHESRGAVELLRQGAHVTSEPDLFELLLSRLESGGYFEARCAALVEKLRALLAPRQRFVIFCSDRSTADALALVLAHQLKVVVDRHDLLQARILLRAVDTESVAVACCNESAFLLAACSTTAEDMESVVSRARKVIAMDFQCDFGREPSSDRHHARTTAGTDKDCFGTQLSAVLREACARSEDDGRPGEMRSEVGITIGWNRSKERRRSRRILSAIRTVAEKRSSSTSIRAPARRGSSTCGPGSQRSFRRSGEMEDGSHFIVWRGHLSLVRPLRRGKCRTELRHDVAGTACFSSAA